MFKYYCAVLSLVSCAHVAYSAESDIHHRSKLRKDYQQLNHKRTEQMPSTEQLHTVIQQQFGSDFVTVTRIDERLADQQLNPVQAACKIERALAEYDEHLKSRKLEVLKALFKNNPEALAFIESTQYRAGGY